MKQPCSNIYKTFREQAGFTQEEVAELLDISVESVRAYEAGKTIPKIDTVDKMCTLYRSPELKLLHIAFITEDEDVIPKVEQRDLCRAVLRFEKRLLDVSHLYERLVEIADDGIVDNYEMEDAVIITKKLLEERKASYELQFALERMGAI